MSSLESYKKDLDRALEYFCDAYAEELEHVQDQLDEANKTIRKLEEKVEELTPE